MNQSGSLVEAGRLRFDFTHHLSLSNEQREKVENLVNKMIFANNDVRAYITTLDYAKEIGAIMIFGEKYGDFVRVLEIGDFSRELCGGTHIAKTGSIGLFKIISEGSIGSNLRRIEAITGREVIKYISKQDKIISSLSELLSVEKSDIIEKIKKLIDDLKKKESELEKIRKKTISSELEVILNKYEEKNEIKIFSGLLKFRNIKDLQSMVRTIQGKFKDSFVVLGSNLKNKAILVTSASGKALEIGIDCNEIANAISKYIDGGGGGKKEFAQVGGKNTKGTKLAIDEAIKIVKDLGKLS